MKFTLNAKTWPQAVLLGILVAALGIPPGAFAAKVPQDQGPQTAPPAQSVPPTPPTGQGKNQQAPKPEAPPPGAISVESTLVNVDAVVTNESGDVLTGLKQDNFRILDNGQPQQISNFAPTEAPITMVILMEFSNRFGGYFAYTAKDFSYSIANALGPKDWVALKTFDMRTNVELDFTQNKSELQQAIVTLFFPSFTEANLFDALLETMDQMRDVQGKKAILVLATGYDTFSKHTLDQTLKRVKESDIPVFCVGVGEQIDLSSASGANIGYLQAKNQLTTFANLTGGYAWFPRFQAETPGIFDAVAGYLRNQYTLGFTPNTPPDGKFHKLTVQAVDEQGNPLTWEDKKGKKKKVIVHARSGYAAPNPSGAIGN